MKTRGSTAASAAARGAVQTIRFTLYVLLLLVGRVVRPIANLATAMGLITFLFCLIFRRDMFTPMWAGAALSVIAVVVTVFYEALLRAAAPHGVVFVSEM